jgi:hypothetical protein
MYLIVIVASPVNVWRFWLKANAAHVVPLSVDTHGYAEFDALTIVTTFVPLYPNP